MRYFLILLLLAGTAGRALAADHLVLVTLDGLRWQELFRGYDEAILQHPDSTRRPAALRLQFGAQTAAQKRARLMPFFWHTIAEQGVLIGNQDKQSVMKLTNGWWFSYPGYNEILTGKADPKINSNAKLANTNVTILEWVNRQLKQPGSVAAFAGWDVFPWIINEARSGVPVNAGFESADWDTLSARANALNELQQQIPSPWHNVRLDAFTYGFAKEYLLANKPRLLYIALGETDDFGHDGDYDQYLQSAHRSDQFIADLWRTIQTTKGLKDNTNLIVAVDHGRGNSPETWPHHASTRALTDYFKADEPQPQGVVDSDSVWLAALGPNINPLGELANVKPYYQNQIAATVLTLLGYDATQYDSDIGDGLDVIAP